MFNKPLIKYGTKDHFTTAKRVVSALLKPYSQKDTSTSDIPTTLQTDIGHFGDDTVIMSRHKNPQIAGARLKNHLI